MMNNVGIDNRFRTRYGVIVISLLTNMSRDQTSELSMSLDSSSSSSDSSSSSSSSAAAAAQSSVSSNASRSYLCLVYTPEISFL